MRALEGGAAWCRKLGTPCCPSDLPALLGSSSLHLATRLVQGLPERLEFPVLSPSTSLCVSLLRVEHIIEARAECIQVGVQLKTPARATDLEEHALISESPQRPQPPAASSRQPSWIWEGLGVVSPRRPSLCFQSQTGAWAWDLLLGAYLPGTLGQWYHPGVAGGHRAHAF